MIWGFLENFHSQIRCLCLIFSKVFCLFLKKFIARKHNSLYDVMEKRKKRKGEIMQEYKPFKEGKVRQIFDIGDQLVMYATDRISAFDYILKNKITDKGAVLTKMSKFWFDFTKILFPII